MEGTEEIRIKNDRLLFTQEIAQCTVLTATRVIETILILTTGATATAAAATEKADGSNPTMKKIRKEVLRSFTWNA